MMRKVVALAAALGVVSLGASLGCHRWYVRASYSEGYYSEPVVVHHVHGGACGHYYWHNAWYDYPHPANCVSVSWHPQEIHVHEEECGHYWWHGCWHDFPHSDDCVAVSWHGPRRVTVLHTHYEGCGHYYWHNAWYDHPHAGHCVDTRWHVALRVEHVHGAGCGHFFWHKAWYDHPHPAGCCEGRPAGGRVVIRGGVRVP